MQIKSILAAAAIALAASVGSAYAADQFATLDGVTVQPMNTAEMDGVRGENITVGVDGCSTGTCTTLTFTEMAAPTQDSFDHIHIDTAFGSRPDGDPRT